MIVDDGQPEVSFKWLQNDGFSLICFTTGQAAIDYLMSAELLPDVIIVSSKLSDMGGCNAVRSIRSIFPNFAIPIMMMSYDSSIEQIREGIEAGCMDYIHRCASHFTLCRSASAGSAWLLFFIVFLITWENSPSSSPLLFYPFIGLILLYL